MAQRAIGDGVPFYMVGADGLIVAANQAFTELSGYTEFELRKKLAKRLLFPSDNDDEGEQDDSLLIQLTDGDIQSYPQWMSLRRRYFGAVPGQLTAIRYPQGEAPLEYILCWFIPMVNGSRAAMETATSYIKEHSEAVKRNTEAIAKLTVPHHHVSQLRQMVNSALNWAWDNPKTAWSLALILYAADPFPTLKYYAAQRGWLPAQPVQIQLEDKKTGSYRAPNRDELEELKHGKPIHHMDAVVGADNISFGDFGKEIIYTTASGATVSWSSDSIGTGNANMPGGRGEFGNSRRSISGGIASPSIRGHGTDPLSVPWYDGRNVF